MHRLLTGVASLVEHGLYARASVVVARGLSSCGTQAQQLWCTALVAPRHVGSSQTRARTRVPCIGRQILNHCATREAPQYDILTSNYICNSFISKQGHILRYWGLGLQHIFWGDTTQPITDYKQNKLIK